MTWRKCVRSLPVKVEYSILFTVLNISLYCLIKIKEMVRMDVDSRCEVARLRRTKGGSSTTQRPDRFFCKFCCFNSFSFFLQTYSIVLKLRL